jgi:aspartyl-tRNA synthetase
LIIGYSYGKVPNRFTIYYRFKEERVLETLGDWKRSCYCGMVSSAHKGAELILMGWVQRRRDHGGVVFIDLRDREGLVQLVFNPEDNKELHARAHDLRSEFVLAVKGLVRARPEGTVNPDLKTGEVEVVVSELRLLNDSAPIPCSPS